MPDDALNMTWHRPALGGNRARMLGNLFWLFTERGLTLACQLIASIALARYLGPAEFGTYSVAIALATFAAIFSALGLNHSLTRALVVEPGGEAEIVSTAIALRMVGAAVSSAAAVLVVGQLYPDYPQLRLMLVALSIGILARSFDAIEFYFHAHLRASALAFSRSVAAAVYLALVLLTIGNEGDLRSFANLKAMEQVLAAALLVAVYVLSSGSPGFAKVTGKRARSLLRKSWPLLLSSFGAIVYFKIDQIMLAAMAGSVQTGIYAVAAQLSEAWYFVPVAIATTAFPELIKTRGRDPGEYAHKLQRLYDFLAILGLASSLVISLCSPWLIDLFYGDEYAAAAPVLSLHVWASVFVFMRAALNKWLIAEELYVFTLLTHGAGALANIALNLALIPLFGATGAAIATVVSYAMASYGSLFLHSSTRPAAMMMTRAIFAPLRLIFR